MSDMETLHQHIFDMMDGLKKGTVKVATAKAMSECAQVLINSVKVELEARKQIGNKQLPSFIPQGQELLPSAEEEAEAVLDEGEEYISPTNEEEETADEEEDDPDAEYYNSLLPPEVPQNVIIHRMRG